jgi:predicted peptidase
MIMRKQLCPAVIRLVGLLCLSASAQEATDESMQKPQKFQRQITRSIEADYLLFLPRDYDAKSSRVWPTILFLHGAGERGSDVWKVAVHGPPKVVKQKKDLPFIVISPQCPEGEHWSNEVLLGLLDDVVKKHRVDTNRLYLTGLSMCG